MTWSLRNVGDPEELVMGATPDHWPRLTREEIVRHAPNASIVARDGEQLVARCSLWWSDVPALEGHRLGAIGHFAADDADAAQAILAESCRQLQAAGCSLAVGPMDGNTWRRYRLVVDPGTEPAFFLEPTNPAAWPEYFTTAGFSALANYTSGVNRDLSIRDPRVEELETRFASRGITLRPLNVTEFEEELARIYSVAAVSFRPNFLYTPIAEAEFAAQYGAVRGVVVPELVLLAEDAGRTVGFTFCLPDLLEKQRTGTLRTAIIKTFAVLPERERYGGLGSLMADRIHRTAQAMGLSRVIHALMHETNRSKSISDRTGSTIRRYALFARELSAG
ncbi:MAG: N-acetyltransferase [Gemmatimonadaceae bacterium]